MQMFWRLFDRLLDGMALAAGVLLVLQVASVTMSVVLRYAVGWSLHGVTSWNEWSLIWVAFLGFAWLERERGHVSMDLLKDKLAPRSRAAFEAGVCIVAAAIAAILAWYGTLITWRYWLEGRYDYFKLAEVLVAPIYAVIPFGSLVLFVQLLRGATSEIKSFLGLHPQHHPTAPTIEGL